MFGEIGRATIEVARELVTVSSLPYAAAKAAILERRKDRRIVAETALHQLYYTAVQPLPLFLALGTVFGVLVTLGSHQLLAQTPLAEHVPTIIVHAVLFELSPLIVALMLTGRTGTAIASELGYMRASQQVDALEAAGINVEYFLVLPRLVGVTAATVLLTISTGFVGIGFGLGIAKLLGKVGVALQLEGLLAAVTPALLLVTLLKAALSGLIIASVNCHFGLSVSRGLSDIPRANVQGTVRCYLGCVAVNAFLSWAVLSTEGSLGP